MLDSKFRYVLFGLFIIQAILSISGLFDFLLDVFRHSEADLLTGPSLASVGQLVGAFIFGTYIVVGVLTLGRDRLHSFELFKTALLVNITITQFFAFYKEQFGAVFGLGFNVLLLIAINFLIQQELINLTAKQQ